MPVCNAVFVIAAVLSVTGSIVLGFSQSDLLTPALKAQMAAQNLNVTESTSLPVD